MKSGSVEATLVRAERYSGLWDQSTVIAMVRALSRIVGGCGLLHNLHHSADDEVFDDHMAEALFVAVFLECGFDVEVYPVGSEGPDLRLSCQEESAYIEVTRFRPKYPGPSPFEKDMENAELSKYGNIRRDMRRTANKIFGKYKQASRPSSIIAIWNDDGDMEEVDVGLAVDDRVQEGTMPDGLEAVVYGSCWVRHQQFYPFTTVPEYSPFVQNVVDRVAGARRSTAVASFVRGVV